ncbi:MAG: class I SAM-dependent methyltransferase [Candidatus Electrothrix sp. AR5]|nr:class I SAM-dependent methyltransferase [Candidatus Electrothrix sp. AR5]
MKLFVRRLLHYFFSNLQRYKKNNVEEIFTDIYKKNIWGGVKGEFYSGDGSSDDEIVSPYISCISYEANNENFFGATFVDLGCGDFRVGRKLLPLCSNYIGVDIVEALIKNNNIKYRNKKTQFCHLNITDDVLPTGDVCFIRQVFQHLSNENIMSILPKLRKYTWVFITEHYPTGNDAIIPNIDKRSGSDIRIRNNSGVYLSEHPFNLPKETIRDVLKISYSKGGEIRTFLYKPND